MAGKRFAVLFSRDKNKQPYVAVEQNLYALGNDDPLHAPPPSIPPIICSILRNTSRDHLEINSQDEQKGREKVGGSRRLSLPPCPPVTPFDVQNHTPEHRQPWSSRPRGSAVPFGGCALKVLEAGFPKQIIAKSRGWGMVRQMRSPVKREGGEMARHRDGVLDLGMGRWAHQGRRRRRQSLGPQELSSNLVPASLLRVVLWWGDHGRGLCSRAEC